MEKKTVSAIMLTLLLTSMLTLAFNIQPVKAEGTIYIRADGSIDPPTAPISTLDNITYTFTDNINDSIVVERSNIVIDGAGYTLQGSGNYDDGFSWWGINNVTIKNTNIKNFGVGIDLVFSSNSSISGNNITANNILGIELFFSSNSSISGNTFTNDGLYVWGSYQNSVENNTVNGRPLVYLEGASNYTIDDAGQVILVRCNNIRVEGLNLSSTSIGIELLETSNSTISGNNITNNTEGIMLFFSSNSSISGNNITANNILGIYLYSSSNSSISGNNITNNWEGMLSSSSNSTISGNNITNNYYGIYLYSSSNSTISGNNITNNYYGIFLSSSSNNRFYHNNLRDNTQQVYFYTTGYANAWDDGYPSGGNYWSDYETRYPDASEIDGSGIWDTPYVIDENNQDNYPLVNLWTSAPPVKFRMGDWVQTTANLNVREGPGLSYTIIDTMPLGTIGQILGGPVEADGFVWWDVDYAVGVRGWSVENWLELHVNGAPTCVVELQQDGVEISEVGVWEFFDIYVGDSTGDTGINQVRFSSDNVQDGYPTGEWTDWFDWDISSEDWYAATKTKRWAFDTPGYKEVWAEVEDETDQTTVDLATIFVPAPALPVLTSALVITPAKDIYNMGDSLEAEFTIKNIGDVPIALDVLTVGGRLNGFIPPEGAPDFTFQSVTLQPGESYQYQGSLTLTQIGSYNFFIAYHIENPTPDEKRLLDENNWNTWAELGEGLTHNDRVKNIIVFEEGTVPEDLLQLERKIDRLKNYHSQYQCPANLLDANSFEGKVSKVWMSFKSFLYSTDLVRQYGEQYSAGVDYERLAYEAVLDAEHFLETGNIEGARRSLTESLQQSILSGKSIAAAAELVDRHMELAEKLAKYVKTTCEVVVRFGVKIVYPPAAPIVDAVYMGMNFYITTKLEGGLQPWKDLAIEILVTQLLKNVEFASLDDDILVDYVNRVAKKSSLDTLFAMDEFMLEFGNELREVIIYRIKDELGHTVSEKLLENYEDIVKYLKSLINRIPVRVECPVELRVLDFKGQITGMVNGTVRHEIPMSLYYNGTVTVFFPAGSYQYEVAGTDEGVYSLEITSLKGGNATTFNATGIPTSPNTIHQYTVDWDALSVSEEGVTVLVDAEGDGMVDRIFSSDSELTSQEFIEKTSPTYLTHALTVIAGEGGTTFPPLGTYACSANSTVQVAAFPNEGYVLDYWELGSVNVGSNNPYTVLMQENHTLNAVFRVGIFDIAVTNVSPSKTVVGEGFALNTNVTVANLGTFTETFNVILFANDTFIELQTVSLTNGTSTTITFTWNTSGFVKGNYTISAYATPVPDETDIEDNTLTDGWIAVTVIGDINGDFKVDIKDLVLVIKYFATYIGYPMWNPNADVNSDVKVDIKDLVLVIKHFGEHYP